VFSLFLRQIINHRQLILPRFAVIAAGPGSLRENPASGGGFLQGHPQWLISSGTGA
jgi:hypothetical protein